MAAPIKKASDLADFTASVGCTGYTQDPDVAPFTIEWGHCTFEGTSVSAYVFPNDAALTSFFDTVKSFGVIKEQTAIKNLYVLAPDDATKLASLKSAVN